jgi:hypothetical protein
MWLHDTIMEIRHTIIDKNTYDSFLKPAQPGRPATLTIRLKVLMVPLNPAVPWDEENWDRSWATTRDKRGIVHGTVTDSNDKPFACRTWLDEEWDAFQIRLKQVVETVWNNQMILLPPDETPVENQLTMQLTMWSGWSGGLSDQNYLQFVSDPQIPAHARGVFDIELIDAKYSWTAHAIIGVARLENREGHAFRSKSSLITNEDVEMYVYRDPRWRSLFFGHLTAAHEIGHNLKDENGNNFQHIDKNNCTRNDNDECQYGKTATKLSAIMGGGNVATEYDAEPWLKRIRIHTHTLMWQYIHRIHFENGQAPVSERQRRLRPAGVRTQ